VNNIVFSDFPDSVVEMSQKFLNFGNYQKWTNFKCTYLRQYFVSDMSDNDNFIVANDIVIALETLL
jgi:hypothetical protein